MQKLSEQDVVSKSILPAITQAGWDLQLQVREQVTFTAGLNAAIWVLN